ncbi:hypothetical protein [Tenacibaculum piscium]|uniref:hypothetical protein n=1 Tax=Tenacibaculum piscium TaxID=1458515 RepID=UPI001F28F040|nr:hypothetical protein [Tenacibaculum piscium]
MSIEEDKNRIERLQNDLNQANLKRQESENELNRTRKNLKEFQLKRQDVEEKLIKAQEELAEIQEEKEESGDDLTEVQEKLTELKSKYKTTSMVLGILLGLSLGACYYFYNLSNESSSFSDDKIAMIKSTENSRVLDSIERANIRALRNSDDTENNQRTGINSENLDQTIEQVSTNTAGETIYSVQIGVFQKNRFPLLSTQTIPSIVTSDNGYFKYSLGLFTTLNEAKKLKKELIKLGISDAFVASYVDGTRQKIHD